MDGQLQAFLQKMHTRCRSGLKLTGCTAMDGMRLERLRGSPSIRELDLMLSPGIEFVELNTNFVLPLLNSMPPLATDIVVDDNSSGLSLVTFRPQRNEAAFAIQYSSDIWQWYNQFSDAFLRIEMPVLPKADSPNTELG